MYVIKIEFLLFLYCNLIITSQELKKISSEKDIILFTESIIRNTTNKLFKDLNLKASRFNGKLKQLSITHNFFTRITLRDHKTATEIIKISRADNNIPNNETKYLIILINEILNEDPNDNEVNEDVAQHVDEFLTNLQGFKENINYNDVYKKLETNEAVLKIIENNNKNRNTSQTNDPSEANLNDDYNVLSDIEFWVPENVTRRIYRGDRTKIKYFPFMASIQIFNSFQCGGSIIKSDLILTAASCLQLAWNNRFFRENPAFLSVRVGSNFYNGGGENIPVLEIYFHPDYNPKNLRNNICVLRLLRKLKFRKNKRRLKKIEIDRQDSPLPMTTDGITIVGWGATGSSNIVKDPWSNRLTFAVLDVYHLQECQEIYSREYVTRTNFCAGFLSKGGGACNRDVGGPGIVNGYLTGVVSFGSPVCGTPDAPTVFTKIGYYADWIEEIMEQDVPYNMKRTTLRPPPLPLTLSGDVLKPTTYKLPPIGSGKMKPIPIYDANALRIVEDEELFKEFLSSMFSSKEVQEYQDLMDTEAVERTVDAEELQRVEKHKEMKIETDKQERQDEEQPAFVTRLYNYDSVTEADFNDEKSDDSIERNIAKLIDNIEADVSHNAVMSPKQSKQVTDDKTKIDKEIGTAVEKNDNSVLTLLYLSDNEKAKNIQDIGSIIEDFDDNFNYGLSIPENSFKDMTYRNNKTESLFDLMTKNELYDLLSEAIDDIAKDNDNK